MTTVRDAIDAAIGKLRARCAEPVELDARFALAHVLGISASELAATPSREITSEARARFDALVTERATGRPLAQVLGEWEFRGVPLFVTPDVLTPRPSTETLVEVALTHIPENQPCRVLDIGTGSGAIAIAIALERPRCHVVGVDLSRPALDVAERNVARHDLGRRIELRRADFQDSGFGEEVGVDTFDLIVSNPPYIAVDDPRVEAHVRQFEPRLALFDASTADGTGAYVRIHDALSARVPLLFEVGESQSAAIRRLLEEAYDVRVHEDLSGIERVVEGLPRRTLET